MSVKKWILSVVLVVLVLIFSPFIIVPMIHDYDLRKMSREFYKREFESKRLPENTKIIDKYSEIAGPWSSNYCTPFTGVFLETKQNYKNIVKYYQNSTIAWIMPDSVIISDTMDGDDKKYPFDCNTCFADGVKRFIKKLNTKGRAKGINYAVVYVDSYYTSDWDMRCH